MRKTKKYAGAQGSRALQPDENRKENEYHMEKTIHEFDPAFPRTKEQAVAFGKLLVQEQVMEYFIKRYYRPPAPLPDKAYEIIGMTGARNTGRATLDFFNEWEKSCFENPVYLRYRNHRLEPCTRQQALRTPEYRNHRILLFGAVETVTGEDGATHWEELRPALAIIEKR